MYHNFRATFSQGQLRISQSLLDTRSIKRESSLEDNFTPSESKNDGSSIGFKWGRVAASVLLTGPHKFTSPEEGAEIFGRLAIGQQLHQVSKEFSNGFFIRLLSQHATEKIPSNSVGPRAERKDGGIYGLKRDFGRFDT